MIRAARVLGAPPWEVQEQPIWWQWAALEAEQAEAAAHEELARQRR